MKPSKHGDRPATLTSTAGLTLGMFLEVNGVWYCLTQIVDDRRVMLKEVRASKQSEVARRMKQA